MPRPAVTPLFDTALRRWGHAWRGTVVGTYPNAALVWSGEDLLTLATATRPLVPDGIVLPPGATLPARGTTVLLTHKELRPAGTPPIRLLGEGVGLQVVPTSVTVTRPRHLRLPPRTRSILGAPTPTPELRTLQQRLRRLVHASGPDTPEAVGALVGLGLGSTPAGDDVLLGVLAARMRLGSDTGPLMEALAHVPPGRTTPVSRQMLRLGAAGRVLLPLHDLIHTMGTPQRWLIASLLAVGGSSGGDMLAGVLAAIDAASENK